MYIETNDTNFNRYPLPAVPATSDESYDWDLVETIIFPKDRFYVPTEEQLAEIFCGDGWSVDFVPDLTDAEVQRLHDEYDARTTNGGDQS